MEQLRELRRPDDSLGRAAGELAEQHQLAGTPGRGRAIHRHLERLDREFATVYRRLQSDPEAVEAQPRIAEWLLDNEYLIREALRLVATGLPPEYYRRLPRLAEAADPDFPRLADLVRVAVRESRLQVDPDQLQHFISCYQELKFLTIGELWAVPAMLRLEVLDVLAGTAGEVFGPAAAGTAKPRAGEAGTDFPPPLPADALSVIAAGIGSLRTLSARDWRGFVEAVSRTEAILRRDPAHVYGRMDFETRDRYRRAVEELARGSGADEETIAQEVLERSMTSPARLDVLERHVGHWLIGDGRPALETSLGFRSAGRARSRRFVLRKAGLLYFLCGSALTLLPLGLLTAASARAGVPAAGIVLLLLLGLVPASAVSLSLTNWLATFLVPPRVLPKLEPSDGIPEYARTVVAIPVLVRDEAEVDSLLTSLEVRYQGNADPNVWWALLTDWADAPTENLATDDAVLERAREGVAKLNTEYGREGHAPFFLLHRSREWNPAERRWMGWERKRGKLHELNQLLLGATDTRLRLVEGDLHQVSGIRYLITLDADTHLPPGTTARLVATLAHPLNRPRFDLRGRVQGGYTVLQPGLETTAGWGEATLFSRIMDRDTGLDLYSHAVSDVYQDLFGEGIYAGKGILDVAAFERCLANRAPDNALLSHDLFEGIHGRVGLVSDVQLLEESPPDLVAYLRRLHRWIRGDWQLLPWLWITVPARDGGRLRNDLSALDRWKVLDNLRRSLLPPSLVSLSLAGWLFGPGSPWLWTIVPLLVLSVPGLFGAASATRRLLWSRRASRWEPLRDRVRLRTVGPMALAGAGRALSTLIFLPCLAFVSLDAIVRTLVRLAITRRHLLEWTTAAHSARASGGRSARSLPLLVLVPGPLVAGASLAAVLAGNPAALGAAAALATPWLVSPALALLTGAPRRPAAMREMQPDERQLLRDVALRTWMFFERLLTSEDHWLPPDNYQEGRAGAVARRTSPTNIGMALTAMLSAWDLGYIGPLELEALVLNTLESMLRLKRHRGHLLNWYGTEDLRPLEPQYVSTVDSGNLAVALITLRHGLTEIARTPVFRPVLMEGLADTIRSADEVLESRGGPELWREVSALRQQLVELQAGSERGTGNLADCYAFLCDLEGRHLAKIDALVAAVVESAVAGVPPSELLALRVWTRKMHQHGGILSRLCRVLHPWLAVLGAAPAALGAAGAGPRGEQLWSELEARLSDPVSLDDLPGLASWARTRIRELLAEVGRELDDTERETVQVWAGRLEQSLEEASREARRLSRSLAEAARIAERLEQEMEFEFLFDRTRGLFRIGFNVSHGELDPNFYDLLASEARLASYVAIARGEVPLEHWLCLGRPYARLGGRPVLLSWAATMFEYLLPQLFLRTEPDTLLGRSCRDAVRQQIRFTRRRGIPWGISESGYHQLGSDASYQYRAFGVPELGLRRDPGGRLVITPYASLLALSVADPQVLRNLRRLVRLGMLGPMGLYEALDYGPPSRLHLSRPRRVRSYMAHHQGMIMVAIGNRLSDRDTAERFGSDARMASVEYLLHERVPWSVPVRQTWTASKHATPFEVPRPSPVQAWSVSPVSPLPETHILSNEAYTVRLTGRGGGASYWKGAALTRWSADPTLDDGGSWIYVRDIDSGDLWSSTPAPAGDDEMTVEFAPQQVEYWGHHDGIGMHTRVTVPPDDDLEIRIVTLTNETLQRRRLVVASYADVVLDREAGYMRHPAYSRLFVQSRWLDSHATLLLWRRPHGPEVSPVFLAHTVICADRPTPPHLSFETSRARFIGRGGDVSWPAALRTGSGVLSGTTGTPLDPILSLSCQFELPAHESRHFAFLTAAAESSRAVQKTLEFYRSFLHVELAFDLARQRMQLTLDDLGIAPHEMEEFQSLLSLLLRSHPGLRAAPETLRAWHRSQPALWKHGISGDHPILLVHLAAADEFASVESLLRAHRYWRTRGQRIDLVLLDLEPAGYARPLRDRLAAALEEGEGLDWLGRPGGIHVVGSETCDAADRVLLESVAGVALDGAGGSLRDRVRAIRRPPAHLPPLGPVVSTSPTRREETPVPLPTDLVLCNGFGGFTPDGREYVIRVRRDRPTPAPWSNVLSNPEFGCIVSESGLDCTWSASSSENRLTPWRNDPLADPPAEAVYLRDEETTDVWSPTPLPCGTEGPYEVRHGSGYTSFRHHSHGLRQQLTVFCSPDAPVKLVRLRLENRQRLPRRITATYFAEWVLGRDRDSSSRFVIPDYDMAHQVLVARNPFSEGFAERVAFLTASEPPHGITSDRTEFLGQNGNPASPAALDRVGLSGAVLPGPDPCAAWMVHVDLAPGETKDVHFVLGQECSREAAVKRALEYRDPAAVDAALERLHGTWDRILGALSVETPDPTMNIALNRWLLYQALACRVWARTALYQSSGAFGFRDQLQDAMALLHAAPDVARAHILEAAGRQFEEGDVLHWWLPDTTTGVRTRCSDDLLWLPYATARYVRVTGDTSILDERVPWIRGPALEPGNSECYGRFEPGSPPESLYEHAARAIDRGSTAGRHGLPLIGSGDWNDGMNRLGVEGRGESVWLAWFLTAVAREFADIARGRGDASRERDLRELAAELPRRVDAAGWDGEWYLRAFHDDGTAIGSSSNREARIDAISQAWSVLAGGGDPDRARTAMASVDRLLVNDEDRLVLLLTPPFDRSHPDPGYIRAYPPGVRENGGQYTHAGTWVAWAFAELGDGERAARLFGYMNPIRRSSAPEEASRYAVEPYAVAADVYGAPPFTGAGGWTWYTGSAAWLYRLGVERILGLNREGDFLRIQPCIPAAWEGFRARLRFGSATYEVRVENTEPAGPGGAGSRSRVRQATLDGRDVPADRVPLSDDGRTHEVLVRM
jgi:cyclic beta-1,2-glucan synthetase